MKFEEIKVKIRTYQNEGKKIFTTSSFQTHSIVLLHIISRIDKSIPVYFVNTGYHFSETIKYKDHIAQLLDLQVKDLLSIIPKHLQKDSMGNLLFTSDPDYCCYLNKVEPVDILLRSMDVWINGIRSDQNDNRKQMKTEEMASYDTIRFHPMLDWNNKMIYAYLKEHNLPKHPLEDEGYHSIGCEPCTRKMLGDDPRTARWFGLNKTECGLNTDLIEKK
ncbi:phosphoadenylyl-sulfate reductase [Bacteroidota bacterium]